MSEDTVPIIEREPCPDCNGDPFTQTLPTGERGCVACSNRGWIGIPVSDCTGRQAMLDLNREGLTNAG